MYAQVSQPPPPLTSRRPDLPASVDHVFTRALAKAPGDRYASCREFADALRAAFGLVSYDSGPEPIPAAHPPAAAHPPSVVHPPSVEYPPAAVHPPSAVHPPAGPARLTSADDVPGPAPPVPPALPAPSVPPAAFGHPGPARQGRSRRAILAALAAALVLVAAAIGAYVLHGRLSGRPLATIPIAAASAIAPVSGDEYVIYRAGQNASARVHGEVRHVIRGETAELYAAVPVPARAGAGRVRRPEGVPQRGGVRVHRDPEPGHALLRRAVRQQQCDHAAGPLADRDHLRHQGRGGRSRPQVR